MTHRPIDARVVEVLYMSNFENRHCGSQPAADNPYFRATGSLSFLSFSFPYFLYLSHSEEERIDSVLQKLKISFMLTDYALSDRRVIVIMIVAIKRNKQLTEPTQENSDDCKRHRPS